MPDNMPNAPPASHPWPARFRWFGFQPSGLLAACLFGSGGSVNHRYSLIISQTVNPITLANRASIHPNAMKYKRRVMLPRAGTIFYFVP